MKVPESVTRRGALRIFGRTAIATTAAAGLADVLGRPSAASANTITQCGNGGYDLAVGKCGSPCSSGYWCYRQVYSGQVFCCQSSGQSHLNCCTYNY